MSEKIYRVQMNNKGMPNFSTAVEIADRPSGAWIVSESALYQCSLCKDIFTWDFNFCPNCGARMKGADDE